MGFLSEMLAFSTRVETARFLVELAVKASVVLLSAAGASWLLRRASAATRHLVWSSALVMVLAMPFGLLLLPRWHVPLVAIDTPSSTVVEPPTFVPAERVSMDVAAPVVKAPERPAVPPDTHSNSTTRSDISVREPTRPWFSAIDWITVALGIWAAGAALTAMRLTLGVVALWMIASRTRSVLSRDWIELIDELSRDLGLTRIVRLLQSRRATMPLSWGCVRPVVLLPANAHTWSMDRRRIVLLHELAHVKRRDCLTQLFAQLACAAYWFNPLVWFAASRMRAERERACDDLVLSAGTRSADYADHLLAIARGFRSAGFPSWATVAMAKPSQLEGRLLAILDPTRRRTWPRWARGVAVGAIAAIALPVAALQPWVSAAQTNIWPPMIREQVDPQEQDKAHDTAKPGGLVEAPAQDTVRGGVRDGIEGGIPGGIAGGVPSGIAGGVHGGLEGGIPGDIGNRLRDQVAGVLASDFARELQQGIDVAVAPVVADGIEKDSDQQPAAVTDRRVIDALVTALKDENKDVRVQAAETLGHVADPRAVDGLTVALRDESPEVREQAASALSRFRSPAAAGALLLALKDQSAAVRREAVHGVARMRDPRHADALTMMLQDADREVRQQAAVGLGQLRAATAIEPLSAALKDADRDVRQQAAAALGQIRDPRTGPALIAALSDSDRDVRQEAVNALAQLRLPASVEPLIAALKDPSADVRQQAAFGLGQIRDLRASDALAAVLKDADADVRQQAAFALGQIRAAAAVPALIAALSDKSGDVREQVAFALGQIRDPRALDALTNALRDPDADVRQQAAFALGQLAHAVGKR